MLSSRSMFAKVCIHKKNLKVVDRLIYHVDYYKQKIVALNKIGRKQKTAYEIERGSRTVAEILSKVGQAPEGYILLEEKNGPPLPLPPNVPVKIRGCEIFHSQTQSGGSS